MPRSILFALFATSAILLAAQRAPAEPAPFPVEPSMVGVEDAFPVAVGRTELELGYLYSTAAKAFDDGGDTFSRGDTATHAGAFTAKHGFTSFLDAGVGIFGGYSRDHDEPELNYDREFATGRKDAEVVAATVGAILNLSDALRADLGFRHGFYGRNADRRLRVTATFLWTF